MRRDYLIIAIFVCVVFAFAGYKGWSFYQQNYMQETLAKCLDKRDYRCIVRLARQFPPEKEDRPDLTNRGVLDAAVSLAYLGEVDEALEIYRTEDLTKYQYVIVSAAILKLVSDNEIEKADAILNGISDLGERILILDSAESDAKRFISHPEFRKRFTKLMDRHLEQVVATKSRDLLEIRSLYSLAATHYSQVKTIGNRMVAGSHKDRFLKDAEEYYQRDVKRQQKHDRILKLIRANKLEDLAGDIHAEIDDGAGAGDSLDNLYVYVTDNDDVIMSLQGQDEDLLDRYIKALIQVSRRYPEVDCGSEIAVLLKACSAKM